MKNSVNFSNIFRAAILLLFCLHAPSVFAETSSPDIENSVPSNARAHWLSQDLIAWDPSASRSLSLVTTEYETGSLESEEREHVLTAAGKIDLAMAKAYPHLKGMQLWRIENAARDNVRTWLKGQVRVIGRDDEGKIIETSGLQIGAVLDELYANEEQLGARFIGDALKISLWAPTARLVRLHLYDSADSEAEASYAMTEDRDTGIWKLDGKAEWNRKYYLYEVHVFAPSTGQMEVNFVTDPYAFNLSANSKRTQFVDLNDADLKPAGWDKLARKLPGAPEDRVLYELHVRDFSISDEAVPAMDRGKYSAFTRLQSNGMRHLKAMADAGLSDVHLLPTYDCATIAELPDAQLSPPDLTTYPANSEMQQAAIEKIRDQDAFNWCYDPLHYMAPEGSYSSNANDISRIRQFREMVASLSEAGLGTILDVVFNHSMASGQSDQSILDRIVPGYYHRLDENGLVARSTCCANTATERKMMEKLMLDSLEVWARHYKVSGFRFDLMGHHSRDSILKARQTLQRLSLEKDSVDGRNIYIYGEGWNFGEVANDARFVQAAQINMGQGTGIGTFNDRIRDAIRGGGVGDKGIDIVRKQGFANGLFTAPNAENEADAQTRARALEIADHIRAGLAGSIRDFSFVAADGQRRKSGDLSYNGSPLGYVSDPQETINYAEAHDNQTFFDIAAFKLPRETSAADRVRWQNIASSIVILSQGVPFIHAGQELLRSKSLDHNSYNSGDWFNFLDYSKRNNGWGRGLPHRADNAGDWPIARELLTDPRMNMAPANIARADQHVQEMLRVRKSSPLFRLRTGQDVMDHVRFDNVGPGQIPGLIIMRLGKDGQDELVVVINTTSQPQTAAVAKGSHYRLHEILQHSGDPVVRKSRAKKGKLITPPLTTSVFVKQN